MPEISVLMCVYNREAYLAEAIKSILDQTYRDLELIVVNDGSTDGSAGIIQKFAALDPRVKYVENPRNMGVTLSVTNGLQYCTGRYIARMDSDDISLPTRLQTQIDYMESHPDVDILGTAYDFIDENGDPTGVTGSRLADPMLTWFEMFYRSAIINATILVKAEVYKKFNQDHREEEFVACEDIAYFLRIGFDHRISNLPQVLYHIRLHHSQISEVRLEQQRSGTIKATQRAFSKILGNDVPFDVVKSFYYSRHYTIEDPRINMLAQKTMFKFQRKFERVYLLDKVQKRETRLLTYDRIKEYTKKYSRNFLTLMNGAIFLFLLRPEYLIKEAIVRVFR